MNLIDEVDLEEFLKEAADAIEDVDRLTGFVREKATIAIERFLVSLFFHSFVEDYNVGSSHDCCRDEPSLARIGCRKCRYRWTDESLAMVGF